MSVAGAVWVILSAFGIPQEIGMTNETYNAVLNGVGAVLIALGIVNNPTEKAAI